MDNKLKKATELIQAKKFSKARAILTKINKKPSYASLELEGVCLSEEKNYKLATIKFEQSIKLAKTNQEKFNSSSNLAAAYLKCEDWRNAAKHLENSQKFSEGETLFQIRSNLTKCYYNLKEYNELIEHASKLKTVTGFNYDAIYMLVVGYVHLGEQEKLDTTIQLVCNEVTHYPIEHLISIAKLLETKSTKTRHITFVKALKNAFGKQGWINQLTQSEDNNFQPNEYAMPKIVAEDDVIRNLLHDICEQTIRLGGRFAKGLSIRVDNGDIWALFEGEFNPEEDIISTAIRGNPMLDDYDLSLTEDGLLICQNKKNQVNPSASDLMHRFISLYNKTRKLETWKSSSAIMNLDLQGDFYKLLAKPVKKSGSLTEYENLPKEQRLIASFFGSRQFSYRPEILNNIGINTSNTQAGLIGVAELLNHSYSAKGFKVNGDTNTVSVFGYKDKNDQLYVKYNSNDPLLNYLIYGYIDHSTPLANSTPFSLTLPNGVLFSVDNQPSSQAVKVDENLKDLGALVPTITMTNAAITLSKLIIPSKTHEKSLLRILTAAFEKYKEEFSYPLNNTQINDYVLQVIEAVKGNNLKHWEHVEKKLQSEQVNISPLQRKDIKKLIKIYKSHFEKY